jgi:hypothetical protein
MAKFTALVDAFVAGCGAGRLRQLERLAGVLAAVTDRVEAIEGVNVHSVTETRNSAARQTYPSACVRIVDRAAGTGAIQYRHIDAFALTKYVL